MLRKNPSCSDHHRGARTLVLARWSIRCAVAVVVALGACLSGCAATLDPASGDPAMDLSHRDPRIRVLASRQAVEDGRLDLAPRLVESLADEERSVRFFAAIALRKLSGESFGFSASDPTAKRQAAIERWRDWLASKTPSKARGETREQDARPVDDVAQSARNAP